MKNLVLPLVAILFASVLFSGCVAAVGNSGYSRSSNTLGQELIDLKKAQDLGIITEDEYKCQRAKLLNSESKKK